MWLRPWARPTRKEIDVGLLRSSTTKENTRIWAINFCWFANNSLYFHVIRDQLEIKEQILRFFEGPSLYRNYMKNNGKCLYHSWILDIFFIFQVISIKVTLRSHLFSRNLRACHRARKYEKMDEILRDLQHFLHNFMEK